MLPYRPAADDVQMIRPSTASPALLRSRQYAAARCTVQNVPRRWTRMTPSQSSGVMFTSIRSRRMPALATTTSSRPNAFSAVCTRRAAPSQSAQSSVLGTAMPPAPWISSTTASAGPADAPEPSTAPPRSLTTTRAPCAASAIAWARPSPRPAPVTTATRPSQSLLIGAPSSVSVAEQLLRALERDLREDALGLRGDLAAGVHRRLGVDAPALAPGVPGGDPQRRPEGGRPPVAHVELHRHAGVAAGHVGRAQHVVERAGDERPVHVARRALVGDAERDAGLQAGLGDLFVDDGRRERVERAADRAEAPVPPGVARGEPERRRVALGAGRGQPARRLPDGRGGLGERLVGGLRAGHLLDQVAQGVRQLLGRRHRALNSGARFSAKARGPSRASSLAKTAIPIRSSTFSASASGSASVSCTERLTARTASGPLAAIRSATVLASVSASPSGTTRLMRPIAAASAAV